MNPLGVGLGVGFGVEIGRHGALRVGRGPGGGRVGTCAGGEKHSQFFNVVLASTGHRGRVDARGPRRHCSAGLTRTSGQAVGAPSRVRRARRLRRRVAGMCATRPTSQAPAGDPVPVADPSAAPAKPHRRSIGRSDALTQPRGAAGAADRPSREGALAAWPEVRVRPAALPKRWPRASTRPRWPVDAKTILKNGECFSPPAKVVAR